MFTLANCRILFSGGIATIILYHLIPNPYHIPALITLFITSIFYIYKRQKLKQEARQLGLTKNLKHARNNNLDQSTSNVSYNLKNYNSQDAIKEGPISSKRILLNAFRRREIPGLTNKEKLVDSMQHSWMLSPYNVQYNNDIHSRHFQKPNKPSKPGITTFIKNTPLSRESSFNIHSSHSQWMKNASFSNSFIGSFPSVHLSKRSPPIKTLPNDLAKSPVTIKIAPPNVLKNTKWVSLPTSPTAESQPLASPSNACDSKTVIAAIRQNRKRLLREKDNDELDLGNITKRQRRDIAMEAPALSSLPEVPPPKVSEHSKDLPQMENTTSLKRPLTPLAVSGQSDGKESTKRACRSHLDVVLSYSSSKNLRANLASKRAKEPSLSPSQPSAKKGNITKSPVLPSSESHSSLDSRAPLEIGPEKAHPSPGATGTDAWLTPAPSGVPATGGFSTPPTTDKPASPSTTKPSPGYHPTLPLPSLPTQQFIPDHLSTVDEHRRDKQIENKRLNFLLAGVKEAFGIKEDNEPQMDLPNPTLSTKTLHFMTSDQIYKSSSKPTQTTVSVSTPISSPSISNISNLAENQSSSKPSSGSTEKDASLTVNLGAPTSTSSSSLQYSFNIPSSASSLPAATTTTTTTTSDPEKTSQISGLKFGVPPTNVSATSSTPVTLLSFSASKNNLPFKSPNFNLEAPKSEQSSQVTSQSSLSFAEISNSATTTAVTTASLPSFNTSSAPSSLGETPAASSLPCSSSLMTNTTASGGFTFGLPSTTKTDASTSSSVFKFGDSTSAITSKESSTKTGGFTFDLQSSQTSTPLVSSPFSSSVPLSSNVTNPSLNLRPLGSSSSRPETSGQVIMTTSSSNMPQQPSTPKSISFGSPAFPPSSHTMTSPIIGFSAIASMTNTSSSYSPRTSIAPPQTSNPLFTSTPSTGNDALKSNSLFTFGNPTSSTGSEMTSSQTFNFGASIASTANTFNTSTFSTTTTQSLVFGQNSTSQTSSSPFGLVPKSQPLFGAAASSNSNNLNESSQPQMSNTFASISSQPLSFGATTTQTNVFGTITSTTAQTPFGSTPITQASNTFDTPIKSAFGAALSPSNTSFVAPSFQQTSFGVTTTTQSSTFGTSSMQTQQQNAFGSSGPPSQLGLFGSQTPSQSVFSPSQASQTNAFGVPNAGAPFGTSSSAQTNVFGTPTTTQAGIFGGSLSQATPFGSAASDGNKPTFGANISNPKPLFSGGSTATPPNFFNPAQSQFGMTQNSFGSSPFTSQTANNPFGGGGGTSNQATAPTQFETMANTQNPFGSSTAAPSFGTPSLQNQTFQFKASTPSNTSTGGFNFASPSNPTSGEPAFKFNAAPTPQFNFGAQSTNFQQQPFTFNASPIPQQTQPLFSIGAGTRNDRRQAHLARRKTAKK